MAKFGLDGNVYWHPDVTDYYRFALSRPELDGLLVSPGTPGEVAALAECWRRARWMTRSRPT